MSDKGSESEVSDHTKKQIAAQKHAQKKAAQNKENQQLINAGKEPRLAKTNALAKAPWYEAERKRRPQDKPEAEVKAASQASNKRKREADGAKNEEGRSGNGRPRLTVAGKVPVPDPSESGDMLDDVDDSFPPRPPTRQPNNAKSATHTQKQKPARSKWRQPAPPSDEDSTTSCESSDTNSDDQDSQGEEESDDDDDEKLGSMNDKELDELIISELPIVVTSRGRQSNSTTNSKTPSAPQSVPQRQQRSVSSPPHPQMSGSSRSFHSDLHTSSPSPPSRIFRSSNSSLNNREASPSPPMRKSQAPRTTSAPVLKKKDRIGQMTKRQEVFSKERPEVLDSDNGVHLKRKERRKKEKAAPMLSSSRRSRPVDPNGSSDDASEPEEAWPKYAQLRGSNLKDQPVLIHQLCRDAILIVQTTLVTKHAWPELNRLAEYRREVLTTAAKALMKVDERYTEIRARIKRDDKFTMIVGKLVMDRLAGVRGPARMKGLDHIAVFQLGVGQICIERVQALVAGETYIYPGKWSTDAQGKQIWVIKSKEIYLNPGIIEVLKSAFFSTPTAFGYKFKAHYKSSHPTRLEPEFPASLVALAVTGLYAGLHAWQGGSKVDQEKFEGDTFKLVFERHLDYLNSIKSDNTIAYHGLMSLIYSKVIDSDASGDSSKMLGNALAVADLSGFM